MAVNNYAAIYKIICKDVCVLDIYVGKTMDFETRKNSHKNCTNNLNNNSILYSCIREHGGWDNWNIEIIEEYNNISQMDLHNRERYWILELKPSLNISIPLQLDILTQNNINNMYEC